MVYINKDVANKEMGDTVKNRLIKIVKFAIQHPRVRSTHLAKEISIGESASPRWIYLF